jgi:hypothetical protein
VIVCVIVCVCGVCVCVYDLNYEHKCMFAKGEEGVYSWNPKP